MGVSRERGGRSPWLPWIFMHDTDKVKEGFNDGIFRSANFSAYALGCSCGDSSGQMYKKLKMMKCSDFAKKN